MGCGGGSAASTSSAGGAAAGSVSPLTSVVWHAASALCRMHSRGAAAFCLNALEASFKRASKSHVQYSERGSSVVDSVNRRSPFHQTPRTTPAPSLDFAVVVCTPTPLLRSSTKPPRWHDNNPPFVVPFTLS
eukprot:401961-Rhodomonas_salina.1